MPSHSTRNDLKSNTKKVSIDLLNARLADAIDLALLTKQAHRNLKGPQFIAIHEMLDGFRRGGRRHRRARRATRRHGGRHQPDRRREDDT